jgi:hypothetical protein
LRRPITEADPLLADDDLAHPRCSRVMPDGLRSWSKSGQLDRLNRNGHFF